MKIVNGKKIYNFTGHAVLLKSGEFEVEIPSDGFVRVKKILKPVSKPNESGFEKFLFVEDNQYENLPPEADNTYYIVSNLTRETCKHRTDFISPASVIRSTTNRSITSCRGFLSNIELGADM